MVEGAGSAELNGVYKPNGLYDGRPFYWLDGIDIHDGSRVGHPENFQASDLIKCIHHPHYKSAISGSLSRMYMYTNPNPEPRGTCPQKRTPIFPSRCGKTGASGGLATPGEATTFTPTRTLAQGPREGRGRRRRAARGMLPRSVSRVVVKQR